MESSAVSDLASLVDKEFVALHPPQIPHLLTVLLSLKLVRGFGAGVVIPSFPELILWSVNFVPSMYVNNS